MEQTIKNQRIEDWKDRIPNEEEKAKVENEFMAYLKKMLGKITFVDDLVALYLLFKDPAYPMFKKGICVFALLYFIMPIDLIPDAIPILGMLDDAAVIIAATKMYADDIRPYKEQAKEWLVNNGFI